MFSVGFFCVMFLHLLKVVLCQNNTTREDIMARFEKEDAAALAIADQSRADAKAVAMMPPDREGAPQAGGKRKNTEPGGRSSPTHQKAVPTTASPHTRKFHSASAGLAAFTHHMTQASHRFDEVQAEMRADYARLRADNAALTARLEVVTKTVKRSKALAVKYYDLCVTSGVDAEVLNGVEEAEESDEEAEEHAEEVEEEQQHVPP
jgi:hypothetical protein